MTDRHDGPTKRPTNRLNKPMMNILFVTYKVRDDFFKNIFSKTLQFSSQCLYKGRFATWPSSVTDQPGHPTGRAGQTGRGQVGPERHSHEPYLDGFWKCNSPMTPHFRLLVCHGWSVGLFSQKGGKQHFNTFIEAPA